MARKDAHIPAKCLYTSILVYMYTSIQQKFGFVKWNILRGRFFRSEEVAFFVVAFRRGAWLLFGVVYLSAGRCFLCDVVCLLAWLAFRREALFSFRRG